MVEALSVQSFSGSAISKGHQQETVVGNGLGIEEPMDLVTLSLKEKVFVKCRHGRELRGRLIVRNLLSLSYTIILCIGI